MKLMMKQILLNTKALILVALASMFMLSSCHHKELCLDHPHEVRVRIDFDWCDAPNADPEGMCVFLYPEAGGDPIRIDYTGKTGGYVNLIPGKYRILTYNNDTEVVNICDENNFYNHGVYTREGDVNDVFNGNANRRLPRAKGTEDQPLIVCPEMMWGYSLVEVDVQGSGVTYTYGPLFGGQPEVPEKDLEEFVIMLFPHELVCIYTYEIRNVVGLNHVTNMAAALSGMAGELKFSDERLDEESSSHIFEANKHDATTITGRFYTFGHHLDNPDIHKMTLYVVMENGNDREYKAYSLPHFDVTEQVHNAPNPRRVHLIIDGLNLPQTISNGSGFAPSVDDWGDVEEEEIKI